MTVGCRPTARTSGACDTDGRLRAPVQRLRTAEHHASTRVGANSLGQGSTLSARYDAPMTPAINLLKREKIAHTVRSYVHDAHAESYGGEAVDKLGLDPAQVFKTLLASTEAHELLVAIVPVAGQLDLKALAEAAGCKKCEMAAADAAQRATGYLVGGISPLGQKKRLRTFLDASAQALPALHVSAGRRGLEVELAPADLLRQTAGHFAAIGKAR